jgi:nitrilase
MPWRPWGEELHVASWPGMWRGGNPAIGERAVEADLGSPFVCDAEFAVREYAAETGNFVLSASGYFPKENIADEWREEIPNLQADWAVGGSSIVAPGGVYLVPPLINLEHPLRRARFQSQAPLESLGRSDWSLRAP